ncbi:hypothetical protein KP509_35G031200 [Ceratopteris richardii]|uniref:Uncharacterized protein n=1 Tax=Ceratopteris richardii TaxID=49495 RepID=A0A8T2QED6_CERRI|nr:hypothetical protein KP509_35G031200 [Ceratopteris richardii]
MDLKVDKSSHGCTQDFPMLGEGERVEVRQKDVGLRGSWHMGTIVSIKAGYREVEYDELLTDDGLCKLRECIPCPNLNQIAGISSPSKRSSSTTATNSALAISSVRTPSKRRGWLRPCPPPLKEPSPLTWRRGFYVEVFYQDAWWEAVLLNDVTSLDNDALFIVIFPDEGDLARVHVNNMRISQCWDEVTGNWSIKGRSNLSQLLRRRGLVLREVTSSADFKCRITELGKDLMCDNSEPYLTGTIQGCPSAGSQYEDKDNLVPPLQDRSNEDAKAVQTTEDLQSEPFACSQPDKSNKAENAVETAKSTGDVYVTPISIEAEHHMGFSEHCDKSSSEALQNLKICHTDSIFGCESETTAFEKALVEREDPMLFRQLTCQGENSELGSGRLTVEGDYVQQNVFFKRRKMREVPSPMYLGAPNPQVAPLSPQVDGSVHCSHMIGKASCSCTGCIDRECELCESCSDSRGGSNLRVVSGPILGVSLNADDMQLSIKDEKNTVTRKQSSSQHSMVFDNGNISSKGNDNLQVSAIQKPFLLALEAPLHVSREGPEAQEAVIEMESSPIRSEKRKTFVQKVAKEDCTVTSINENESGGVCEKSTRRLSLRPRQSICNSAQTSGANVLQSTRSRKPSQEKAAFGRETRPERNMLKRTCRAHFVEKAMLMGVRHESRGGVSEGKNSSLRPVGMAVSEGENDTLGSFREQLLRRKPISDLKRKASGLSLSPSKVVMKDKKKHGDKILSLPAFEGNTVAKRRVKKIKTSAAQNPSDIDLKRDKSSKVRVMGQNHEREIFKVTRALMSEVAKGKIGASCLSEIEVINLNQKKKTLVNEMSLKNLVSEIGKTACLEAGCTIEYRQRKSCYHFDAVYVSPKGSTYWSLPRAWHALGMEKQKVRLKVEKSIIQKVLSKINQNQQLQSAFKMLDRFSGKSVQEIMDSVSMTYAELTDLLIEDLKILKKDTVKKKDTQGKTMSKGMPDNTNSNKKKSKQKHDAKIFAGKGSCKASMTAVYSRLKYIQDRSPGKLDKNKASQKAELGILKSKSSKKQRFLLKGLLKGGKIGEGKFNHGSTLGKDDGLERRSGLRLEVRSSSSCMEDASEDLSCESKRTIFSWMISRGSVLEKERISCVDQETDRCLKEGMLTEAGILCMCCMEVYSVEGFKDHGRGEVRKLLCNLFFASGRSFLDAQLDAWDKEIQQRRTKNYIGVTPDDTNDDSCLLCGDGGDLLCCDFCPSTFHPSCLELVNVPEGDWYCPLCRCGVCKGSDGFKELEVCKQCEHRYHLSCLQGNQIVFQQPFMCGDSCKKIYSSLRNLIGISHPLGGGFYWTLLQCTEELEAEDLQSTLDVNSKLAVALLVLKECFNPMSDPRTNIDMITHAAYNRRSEFSRLNYAGFYTVVLEQDNEIISAASIRVHGARIAEMPLIGTRHKYRRQGMCRRLVGAIEKLLSSLGVVNFILPAIQELYETWTNAFGFKPLDSSLILETKYLSMMMFPGTDLLQKCLLGDATVSSNEQIQ